jgi:hypothetical protein
MIERLTPRGQRSSGNYREYEADKKRRLRPAADIPHRIKYKRLVRA